MTKIKLIRNFVRKMGFFPKRSFENVVLKIFSVPPNSAPSLLPWETLSDFVGQDVHFCIRRITMRPRVEDCDDDGVLGDISVKTSHVYVRATSITQPATHMELE